MSLQGARSVCQQSSSRAELRAVEDILRGLAVSPEACVGLARAVTDVPSTQAPILELKARVVEAGLPPGSCALEQYILLAAAEATLQSVDTARLDEAGKERVYEAFEFLGTSNPRLLTGFAAGHPSFAALCKIATLRRFPVGIFEWEVSGMPRSIVPRVRPRDLPLLAYTVLARMGGVRPLIVPHFAVCGGKRIAIPEREVYRGFHRIAQAARIRPEIRGAMSMSWLFAPDVGELSSHLAYLPRLILENGGFLTTVGAADEGSGVMDGSPRRRAMVAGGDVQPRLGLFLWPRVELLAWADRNPHLGD